MTYTSQISRNIVDEKSILILIAESHQIPVMCKLYFLPSSSKVCHVGFSRDSFSLSHSLSGYTLWPCKTEDVAGQQAR